jgi:hypothetical protein
MRSRIFVGVVVLAGVVAAATLTAAARKSAVTTFDRPTTVAGTVVQGRVVIVHDDEKMAKGEPCTTIYRSASGDRRGKALVSFHCVPIQRPVTEYLRVTCATVGGTEVLKEYQFGRDTEGHGVPQSQ